MKINRKLIVVCGLIIILCIIMMLPIITMEKESSTTYKCNACLKRLNIAMQMYATVFNDNFPDKEGAKGMEQLRKEGFLKDVGMITCPGSLKPRTKHNTPITENNFNYFYRCGLKSDSSKNTPIVWDKPNNHNKFGNVLFVDGHVKGYAGVNWMKKAGIPKEWIEKSEK